jgi:hypothetical protein
MWIAERHVRKYDRWPSVICVKPADTKELLHEMAFHYSRMITRDPLPRFDVENLSIYTHGGLIKVMTVDEHGVLLTDKEIYRAMDGK